MTTLELPVHTELTGETGQSSHHVSIGGSEAQPQICIECGNPQNNEKDCISKGRATCSSQPYCLGCEIVVWALEPYKAWLKELKESGKRKRIMVNGSDYLQSHHGAYLWDRVNILIRSEPHEPTEGVSPELISESKTSGMTPILQILLMVTGSPCPWNFPRIGPEISGYTGSSAAIEKARTWYSECLTDHKRCLQNSGSSLPTRIILIEGIAKARLHTSDTETAPYACLSHCWGGQSVIRTTTRTLKQFTTNLPWEELPQTFQDAIQFAHGLGFKYLWIDSLC